MLCSKMEHLLVKGKTILGQWFGSLSSGIESLYSCFLKIPPRVYSLLDLLLFEFIGRASGNEL